MSAYNTVDIHTLANTVEEFGPIEFQDILGNDLVAHSVEFPADGVDTIAFITASLPETPNRKLTMRVVSGEEFYALIPHKMDNVVLHDSVVKAMESVYAAMMAANAVNSSETDLDWAYQNSIYGALEMTLIKMLLDVSDADTAWTNEVMNSILNSGEVRYILAQYTAINANA